jgi:hypothetical protein
MSVISGWYRWANTGVSVSRWGGDLQLRQQGKKNWKGLINLKLFAHPKGGAMRLQLPEGQELGICLERLKWWSYELAVAEITGAGELLRIQISAEPCLQVRLAVSVDTLTLRKRSMERDAGKMMVGGKNNGRSERPRLWVGLERSTVVVWLTGMERHRIIPEFRS